MSRSLPPLKALRAFEASARHLSFTKAAAELHVTPAAVGHQVKTLERWFGFALFRRLNRALALTEPGRACLPLLTDGFDQLALASERAQRHDDQSLLRATVAPTLAVKWLVPRLPAFHAFHPELKVRLETSMEMIELEREGIDIGLRFCAGPTEGLRSDLLFEEEVIAVCSPGLIENGPALVYPNDLRHYTLIEVEDETADPSRIDWATWLTRVGANDVEPTNALRFTQTIVAAQAALDGQGVALLGRTCVLDDLANGRLVQPFYIDAPTDFSFFIVSPEARYDQPKVVAFRSWLIEAAGHSLEAALRV